MVGTGLSGRAVRKRAGKAGDAVALEVRDVSVGSSCRNVTFSIRDGERVGLAGLAGSGKAELADAVAGTLAPAKGQVLVHGRRLHPGRVDLAIARGVGYVPEDRHARGLAPNLSVEENVTLTVARHLGPAGIVQPRRRYALARKLIHSLSIVASSPRQRISELSGGNQQMAVMGRALASKPRVLVLVSPTAGVDIASKEALYEAIQAAEDVAVLLVSDELDELAICDRLLVMFAGDIVREFEGDWAEADVVAAIEGVKAS
jgi:simple sugar transport system ATP-binding protein